MIILVSNDRRCVPVPMENLCIKGASNGRCFLLISGGFSGLMCQVGTQHEIKIGTRKKAIRWFLIVKKKISRRPSLLSSEAQGQAFEGHQKEGWMHFRKCGTRWCIHIGQSHNGQGCEPLSGH